MQPCDRKRLPHESAREYDTAFRRLVTRAYPSDDFTTQDLLAKVNFISNIGQSEVRIQLRTAKLGMLEEAINVTSQLELIWD